LKACVGLGRTRLLGLGLDESLVWKARRWRCCCCVGVLEFDPLEVAFEFTNLSAVSIHRVLDAVPLLVDLLDDDLGVAKSQ
jgi:hypothetical protein